MIRITYLLAVATNRELEPRLSARLTCLLKRALVDLEDLHAEHLAPVGVSGREPAVLLLLDGRDPQSQQQAAGRLGLDRTTMVGLLDGLQTKGLVARHADAGDRRRNVLKLTGDGQKTLARALRASDEAERQLLAVLDDAESTQLRTVLTRMARNRSEP